MKGVIFLMGASFRQAGKYFGEIKSVEEQTLACNSHVKLIIRLIEEWKCNIDVVIVTYATPYNDMLVAQYGSYLTGIYSLNPYKMVGIKGLYNVCQEYAEGKEYDFISYIRIDLLLKQFFIDRFDPTCAKIMFPFSCITLHGDMFHPNIETSVGDVIVFIPKKFIEKVSVIDVVSHHGLERLLNIGINREDIGFYTYSHHDTNTSKDWNPIYVMVDRRRSYTWHSYLILAHPLVTKEQWEEHKQLIEFYEQDAGEKKEKPKLFNLYKYICPPINT